MDFCKTAISSFFLRCSSRSLHSCNSHALSCHLIFLLVHVSLTFSCKITAGMGCVATETETSSFQIMFIDLELQVLHDSRDDKKTKSGPWTPDPRQNSNPLCCCCCIINKSIQPINTMRRHIALILIRLD